VPKETRQDQNDKGVGGGRRGWHNRQGGKGGGRAAGKWRFNTAATAGAIHPMCNTMAGLATSLMQWNRFGQAVADLPKGPPQGQPARQQHELKQLGPPLGSAAATAEAARANTAGREVGLLQCSSSNGSSCCRNASRR